MSPIPSLSPTRSSPIRWVTAPPLEAVERGSSELGLGSEGASVKSLQTLLNRGGAEPPLVVDGYFGSKTEDALRNAQAELGIGATGRAGRSTFELLRQRTSSFERPGPRATPPPRSTEPTARPATTARSTEPTARPASTAPRVDQPAPAGSVRVGDAARRSGTTTDVRAARAALRPPTPAVRTTATATTATAHPAPAATSTPPRATTTQPRPSTTTQPRTWDHAPGTRGGVYLSEHANAAASLDTANARFPGSGTFLWYKSVDGAPSDVPAAFFQQARAAGVVPQLAFESNHHTLAELQAALVGKGQLPTDTGDATRDAKNRESNEIHAHLVAWADHLKGQGPVIFRPLSEMNDASGAWELGAPGKGNTPAQFADVWNRMHQLFDERGATNLRWSFDVLAGKGGPNALRGGLVEETLRRIPARNIDDVSMNPYARMQPNGQPTPFSALVEPWMDVFQRTGHGNARPMISEMGVSNNALVPSGSAFYAQHRNDATLVAPGTPAYDHLDAQRAAWIHDAFTYARAHGYSTVTYFTQMNTNWRLDPGSQAERALQEELAR